jgi:hypothetical protein
MLAAVGRAQLGTMHADDHGTCMEHRRPIYDAESKDRGAQIHLGLPGEPGKWGRSSLTDQGRVSPPQAQTKHTFNP